MPTGRCTRRSARERRTSGSTPTASRSPPWRLASKSPERAPARTLAFPHVAVGILHVAAELLPIFRAHAVAAPDFAPVVIAARRVDVLAQPLALFVAHVRRRPALGAAAFAGLGSRR